MIPILIICYNNFKYVEMMIKQLEHYIQTPNIIIIDNHSNCTRTIKFLQQVKYNVIYSDKNKGHKVWSSIDIYSKLPYRFIITDPDLVFNSKMPSNFIEIMIHISNKYKSRRVGFAISIDDYEHMLLGCKELDHQKKNWKLKIPDDDYEIYDSKIDTTFCLISKHIGYNNRHIRIAGDFVMKHLPWYKDSFLSPYERFMVCKDANQSSQSRQLEMNYMDECHLTPIKKNNEYIIISTESTYAHFWLHIFPTLDTNLFNILDTYLDSDKQFLDIGASFGSISLYAMKKSCYTVSIEADPNSIQELKQNIDLNLCNPIDIEESILYHTSGLNLAFGRSDLTDSYCRIKQFKTLESDIFIKTVSLGEIISKYKLDNLSMIMVDIEGSEEFIMWDLSNYIGQIPILVRFHYANWRDKDIHRFSFLPYEYKQQIMANPFSSLVLFCPSV